MQSGKVGLKTLFTHFAKMMQAELKANPRYREDAMVRADRHIKVADAILRRHGTVQRKGHYPAAEQFSGYAGHAEITGEGCMHYVFPTYVSRMGKMRQVNYTDAVNAVKLQNLKPAADYNQDFFVEIGLLKPYDEPGSASSRSPSQVDHKFMFQSIVQLPSFPSQAMQFVLLSKNFTSESFSSMGVQRSQFVNETNLRPAVIISPLVS